MYDMSSHVDQKEAEEEGEGGLGRTKQTPWFSTHRPDSSRWITVRSASMIDLPAYVCFKNVFLLGIT